jgi:hypothetical protein
MEDQPPKHEQEMLSSDLVRRFAALFHGYDRAYGTYAISQVAENGKHTGKATTVRQDVVPLLYERHLQGEGPGLGIIPLREDDTVYFGAIDYDNRNMDHVKAEQAIRSNGLPLVLCRSKSGGGHFYCFLKEPVPAAILRKQLSGWAAVLRMPPKVELFPKQVRRTGDDDVGTFINLPYFKASETKRYAFIDGEPASFSTFLTYAETHKCSLAFDTTLESDTENTDSTGSVEESPIVLPDTISEGERNSTLTSLAGSMRRRGATEESIAAALLVENQARCQPPLPEQEVRAIAKSISKYPPETIQHPPISISQWPDPALPHAFTGVAGDLIRAIAPHTEADPIGMLVQLLTAFGSAVGRDVFFPVGADYHRMNLNVLTVGPTSTGAKGMAWGQVKRIAKRMDEIWGRNCLSEGLSSGEGLIWAVRDPIEITDPETGEEKVVDPGVEDKRLLVTETEFVKTLKVMAREGNTLSAVIRQAWDTSDLRIMTKNSPAKATGAHISIIGHITPDELRRTLAEADVANGFLNRFLILCVRRQRLLPNGGGNPNVDELIKRLGGALSFAKRLNDLGNLNSDHHGELYRDKEAGALWKDVYESLTEDRPGMLGAATSRAAAQVLRLQCLYALLDCSPVVHIQHVLAALALWDYSVRSAEFLFSNRLVFCPINFLHYFCSGSGVLFLEPLCQSPVAPATSN